MSITAKPTPCAFGCLAYHSGLAGLVLLNTGSYPAYVQQATLNTWLWKSGAWSLLQTGLANNPQPRTDTSMAFNGTNMYLFGGRGVPGTEFRNDLWSLNASGVWSQVEPNYNSIGKQIVPVSTTVNTGVYPNQVVQSWVNNLGLNIRCKTFMAQLGSNILLFGGQDYNQLCYQQNWIWNGTSWTQSTSPTTYPTIRTGAVYASDGATNMVFGLGAGTSWLLSDMWIYTTGSGNWTKMTTSTAPSNRRNAVMTWLPSASAFIMVGGEDSSGDLLNEVWKFAISGTNGTWTKLSITNPAVGQPARRTGAMLAYDTTSSQLILFGGAGTGMTLFADTWQLTVSGSNATWTLLANAL
jgi:hypothetical protein